MRFQALRGGFGPDDNRPTRISTASNDRVIALLQTANANWTAKCHRHITSNQKHVINVTIVYRCPISVLCPVLK